MFSYLKTSKIQKSYEVKQKGKLIKLIDKNNSFDQS